MQSSSNRRRLPQLIFVIAALTVGVFLSGADTGKVHAIGTFNAATETALCSGSADGDWSSGNVDATDNLCSDGAGAIAAGVPSDVTTKLAIALADYNFSQVVTTIPGSAFVAPGPGFAGHGAAHPQLGDILGQLTSDTNLGLTNGNCGTALTVPFKFINATVNNAEVNEVHALPPAVAGSQGTLEVMQSDQASATTSTPAQPADGSIPANGLAAAVDRYPSYLNAIFDPDFTNYGADGNPSGSSFDTDGEVNGAAPPVQPIERVRGGTIVSGTAVELNLMVFEPGDLAAAFTAPHPFSDLVTELGYTTVTVLQNPSAAAAPSAITDFCASLSTITTVWGEARANPCNTGSTAPCSSTGLISNPTVGANLGTDRTTTPASAGTYAYVGYSASLRDTDGDGYENALDTCAGPDGADNDGDTVVDEPDEMVNSQNPKVTSGADSDMIDPVCDPTDATDSGSGNHDGDLASNGGAWQNAGDNCPLVPNTTQLESELDLSYNNLLATNPAPQGGPKTDAIGDACDTDDAKATGDYLAALSVTLKCIGGTDGDGDGACLTSAAPGILTNDPNDASAAVTPEDYDLVYTFGVAHAGAGDNPPERQPLQVCNDGLDNDGDTLVDNLDSGGVAAGIVNSACRPSAVAGHPGFPACPLNGCAIDFDGDGASNEVERHLGTNPLGRCGVGAVPATSPAWPLDFASGSGSVDRITITDLTSYISPRRLDTKPGDALFNVRWDLGPGPSSGSNWIAIGDLTALFAGAHGFPSMNSGGKVFGAAFICSAHPTYGQ